MSHTKKTQDEIRRQIDSVIIPLAKVQTVRKKAGKKPVPVPPENRFPPDPRKGLSTNQVSERMLQGQFNRKGKQYSKSTAKIICSNLFTFFNLLCLICIVALISVKASVFNFTFALTYIFNLSIGIFQEIKAKKAIEKLSLLNTPTAQVVRDGRLTDISVNDIVLDDVIRFGSGNQISADCTVLEGMIEVNESLLTGESVPVRKQQGDTLYAGSFVVSGSAYAVADKVGEDRYIQTLSAKAKKFKKPSSELLRSLLWIIRCIGILIVPIGAGVLFTNYKVTISGGLPKFVQNGSLTFDGMREIITRTTSVIIGMIPAGMFLLTTLALAVGVVRLAKRNTSVQDMYSLEMLARVDVLCLDKTGTITDGRMKVANCILFNSSYRYSLNDIISSMQYALPDNNQTAIALKSYFGNDLKLAASKVIPFSSGRKYSAVCLNDTESDLGTFALGAPEFVMGKKTLSRNVQTQINRYTALGQRVLLLAHSPNAPTGDTLPYDLKPFALITLTDNVRRDAIKTINWFKKNDVAVKVISGDNPVTVSEVARRAGVEGADRYVSLDGMSDSEVINVATKYNVFGRVSPEQKALLVQALKTAGHTVAMTGDGVNDILAMKESDCSITVATGSDATKNIAHLVLMDNNFDSLPAVVGEGRRVINNIEKSSSLYLMKTLFITLFAIMSILRGTIFPFDNQMLVLLETVVIGLGSLSLSLQTNMNKVDGKFISYVFAHAIPGATILILNVLAFDILNTLPWEIVIPPAFKDTLMVAALTFGGLVYLYIICKPLNLFRGVLVFVLTAICIVFIGFLMPMFNLPNIFSDPKDNWQYVVLLLCLLQFDVTLAHFLTFVTEKIRSEVKFGASAR